MNRDQQARLGKVSRGYGLSPDQRVAQGNLFNTYNDWYTTCPVCGETLTGTLSQLKGHVHDKSGQ